MLQYAGQLRAHLLGCVLLELTSKCIHVWELHSGARCWLSCCGMQLLARRLPLRSRSRQHIRLQRRLWWQLLLTRSFMADLMASCRSWAAGRMIGSRGRLHRLHAGADGSGRQAGKGDSGGIGAGAGTPGIGVVPVCPAAHAHLCMPLSHHPACMRNNGRNALHTLQFLHVHSTPAILQRFCSDTYSMSQCWSNMISALLDSWQP